MPQPLLFQKIVLRGVSTKNRIMISPICQYSALDGAPGTWCISANSRKAAPAS
jgi:2,4-dienoyl-CoA reductase-like NADH-dependent reductase (Old Yellow Enzyme family)